LVDNAADVSRQPANRAIQCSRAPSRAAYCQLNPPGSSRVLLRTRTRTPRRRMFLRLAGATRRVRDVIVSLASTRVEHRARDLPLITTAQSKKPRAFVFYLYHLSFIDYDDNLGFTDSSIVLSRRCD